MQPTKKSGRIVGLFFLGMLLAGAFSINLRGLSRTLLESENLLQLVSGQYAQMKTAIFLDLLAGFLGVSAAIYIYQILEPYTRMTALWYLAAAILNFGLGMAGDMGHLSLLELSRMSSEIPANTETVYNIAAQGYINQYFWAHFFSLILYSFSSILLFWAFFKLRLIPRILAGWGMIALLLVFTATVLQLNQVDVNFILYQQNGIHFIVLIIWLLTKGFKNPEEKSQAALV